jgi:SNF2 family DNA or RNA helicase
MVGLRNRDALHYYQQYSVDFIETHPVSAILLACGLGKTIITLTALNDLLFDSFEAHRVLVIAPLRVASMSWPDEFGKWEHLSELKYSVAVGTETERRAALMKPADIYIINRENVQWLIEDSKLPFSFDTVVVDELSSFKNLWAEFRLLDMGARLGRFISQYRLEYFQPDKRNGQVIFSYKPLPGAEQRIYDKISDITISMRSTDLLKMPELVSSEYTVRLSDEERERYDGLKQDLVLQLPDGEITAANAAALTGKLCQMANGAIYTDDGGIVNLHDQKLDALEDIIEAAGGKPLLVAYWFKHDLARITERLQKLHVPFSKLDSAESIKRWNNGELPVALIHPASAGHGLNLQSGGSCIVWFGLTWSLELYQQTNARLWRQGQSAETVVVQHIVTKGTIDERILKVLSKKDSTQAALIDAVKADLHI